jgi:uncharacterized protein YegL
MNYSVTAALFLFVVLAVRLSTVESDPSPNVCDPHCRPLPNACKKQGPGKCDASKGCIDGYELTPEFTCGCARPLDIVFMIDESGSVGPTNFALLKTFVNAIVGILKVSPDGTHVGVIRFASTATVEFLLNTHLTTPAVQNAITNIVYHGGGTNMNSALTLALNNLFLASNGARSGSDVAKVAVLLTDGHEGNTGAVATAQLMRDAGIRVMAVGIGLNVNYNYLLSIVLTADNLFNATDFSQLVDQLANSITSEICNSAGDCPGYPCFNGGTCSTNPPRGQFMCICLPEFTGPHCQHDIGDE